MQTKARSRGLLMDPGGDRPPADPFLFLSCPPSPKDIDLKTATLGLRLAVIHSIASGKAIHNASNDCARLT